MRISINGSIKLIRPELLKRALITSALIVQDAAKNLCPVDTGRLRSSIIFTTEDYNGGTFPPAVSNGKKEPQQPAESDRLSQPDREMIAKIGTNVQYAEYNEYYANNGANSFLRPAMFNTKKDIENVFKNALKESIKG